MSVNILGFPCPADFFIHCPTKNPKRVSLPLLYSATCPALSAMIASTMASRAPVSLVCLSPRVSTHVRAMPHSNTSFSITVLELVDESSSAFTILMTSAISAVSAFMSRSPILSVCHSNIAKSTVVIYEHDFFGSQVSATSCS